MAGERVVRRLAAILAADVVGYSRLMGRDENATLARLKAHRTERLEPVLAHHGGRLVKLTGDGALVEFASAVDAVSAAIEFQQVMSEANRHLPEDTAIVFRIGLHLGDLIVDGDDLYGDGVNVAARLEAEAPSGGIVISRTVHEAVMGRLKATFDDLGSLALKNLERPVQAFRVGWDPADWQMSAAALIAPVGSPATTIDPLALPDKPSIAVLPFQNMSGDPEQEYFADGMVEDIITALCRTKLLFVIARNSSFSYKGKSPDIRQVGRELGVRYVLEGSVRKAGNQLRITGQLIDASNGAHLWADRFSGSLEDIFELQDQVASRVVGAISPALERAEMARSRQKPTENLQAYDYYLRAPACIYLQKKDANYEAVDLLDKAIGLDPVFALAFAQAATCYTQRKTWRWSADPARDVVEAEKLARRALELDRNDPTVLAYAGWALALMAGRFVEAAELFDRAIELDPNHFLGSAWGGWTNLFLGRPAIEHFERALRLSPRDPRIFVPQSGIATAYLLMARYDEALSWAGRALQELPNFPPALRTAMVSYALAGRIDEARQACAVYRQFDPAARISSSREWMLFQRGEDIEKFEKALRLAGLPE
jgi:adenylate cyclase